MKYIRTILVLSLIVCLLSGCGFVKREPISKTGFYFDTVISITIYDSNDTKLLTQCFSYCDEFEQLVSRTIENSEIFQINHANGKPVTVSETTLELIQKGIEYGELTNGAFDITIAPLSTLWDFKNNPGTLPSKETIEETLSHVDYRNIKIEGTTIQLTDPKAAIDLGGIAKGYMADRLKEYLESAGVTSALINLGGNVLTIGTKPDGTAFNIGIQKPFDEGNAAITSVSSSNSSVVTSGSYERYFRTENDTLYHHILDTATGYPCDTGLLSVTILSDKSVDGDALSTACFTLGVEKGTELIHSLDNIDALFITENYEIIDTRTH